MTVGRLLAEVDGRELAEWRAFNRLHPIDHAGRAELSTATIAMLTYNASRSKDAGALTADAFTPKWGREYRKRRPRSRVKVPAPEVVAEKIDAIFSNWGK